MRRLSDPTCDLLQQLHAARENAHRPGTAAERVRLIEQIGDRRELPAVLPLLPYLFDSSTGVAADAADAIHQALEAAPPAELLALDAQVRYRASWDSTTRWHRLGPNDLPALANVEKTRTAILGLASFHPNGYVRERAIRLLAANRDGTELPFLLIRLNDWVGVVRDAAREAVEHRLRHGPIGPFLRSLPLILRLTECRRDQHAGFVEAVVGRLVEPAHEADLLAIVRGHARPVAGHCFKLAAHIPGAHLARPVAVGLQAKDPVLGLWAMRLLPATAAGPRLEGALSALARDKSMPVRREALRLRIAILPATAAPALRTALLDPNPAVREFARFHLARAGWDDVTVLYRTAVGRPRDRTAGIAGLGETGTQSDAALLLAFLTDPDSRVRQAAVRAVGRLAADASLDRLVDRLTDESPKVIRVAQKALDSHGLRLDPKRLWAIYGNHSRRQVRAAVLALVAKTGTWRSLPYLLRAAADPDPATARRAMAHVERRFNRVFTKPTAEERGRIVATLGDCAGALDPTFRARLQYHLGIDLTAN